VPIPARVHSGAAAFIALDTAKEPILTDRHAHRSRSHQGRTHLENAGPECGFKQANDELGWADFRLTDAASIERWWELVLCAYLFVSQQFPVFPAPEASTSPATTREHPAWTEDASWKHVLQVGTIRAITGYPHACAHHPTVDEA
jgi:hypothetical protein